MKKLTVAKLVGKVRTCIDEIALNDAEFTSEQDNSEMETIIREKIPDALVYVLGNADADLLEADTVFTSGDGHEHAEVTTEIGDDLVGRMSMPDNFLRVCYARFESWPIYATEAILMPEKEYAMLQDPYTTGTWERPKIALLRKTKPVLELYRAKDKKDKWEVGLVTKPDIDTEKDEGEVNLPDHLVTAVVYQIAGLTLMTYDEQRADNMFNMALIYMGIDTTRNANDANNA